nr:3-ketoacyl-CoA synthase 20-like [Ipomoea batatas]
MGKFYSKNRPRNVYLVDFACYKPKPELMSTTERYIERSRQTNIFTEESLSFQKKVLERSGLGQKTYFPESILGVHAKPRLDEVRKDAEAAIFGCIDEVLDKTGVKAEDIGIVVVNSSVFDPAPSLSAMIVRRYKLLNTVKSFNLGGMGCSAGLISIDLAKHLLQVSFPVSPNCYALVVSTEIQSLSWYLGNDRSMLMSNCIFRLGGAAVLLSNRPSDRRRSKYQLMRTVRTHTGAHDNSHSCVWLKEDDDGRVGVAPLQRPDGHGRRGPEDEHHHTRPLSPPHLRTTAVFPHPRRQKSVKPYIPDFKLAFDHFCIHAGGKAVLDAIEKNLELSEWHMEPSRMTLYRFGNISSSSLWYELAYTEAKGRIRKGDKTWQIAFGSGALSAHYFFTLKLNLAPVLACSSFLVFMGKFYSKNRPRNVYLVDFACYKPKPELMSTTERYIERSRQTNIFTEESLSFQKKVLERSGLGQKTYFPESILGVHVKPRLDEVRKDAEAAIFGCIDEVLDKTGVKAEDIGIVVVNSSVFDPAPSLSAMIVKRYKLVSSVKSFNLGGMGCSAGLISIDLAKHLLQISFPISFSVYIILE